MGLEELLLNSYNKEIGVMEEKSWNHLKPS